jgi:hypothetical protein
MNKRVDMNGENGWRRREWMEKEGRKIKHKNRKERKRGEKV